MLSLSKHFYIKDVSTDSSICISLLNSESSILPKKRNNDTNAYLSISNDDVSFFRKNSQVPLFYTKKGPHQGTVRTKV